MACVCVHICEHTCVCKQIQKTSQLVSFSANGVKIKLQWICYFLKYHWQEIELCFP